MDTIENKQFHVAARAADADLLDFYSSKEQWQDAIFAAHALSLKTRFVLLALVADALDNSIEPGACSFQVRWHGMDDTLGLPCGSIAQTVRDAEQLGIVLNPRDPEMPDLLLLNGQWLKSVRTNMVKRRGLNI